VSTERTGGSESSATVHRPVNVMDTTAAGGFNTHYSIEEVGLIHIMV
jgi:hypothetical protein